MPCASTMSYDIPASYQMLQIAGAYDAGAKIAFDVPPPSFPIPRTPGSSASEYVPLRWGADYAALVAKLESLVDNVSLAPRGAPAPELKAIELARIILNRFHKISAMPDKIVATAEGGAAICFAEGDKYADIECLNGGAVLGVTTDRRGRPDVWEISQTSFGIGSACSRIKEFIGRRA